MVTLKTKTTTTSTMAITSGLGFLMTWLYDGKLCGQPNGALSWRLYALWRHVATTYASFLKSARIQRSIWILHLDIREIAIYPSIPGSENRSSQEYARSAYQLGPKLDENDCGIWQLSFERNAKSVRLCFMTNTWRSWGRYSWLQSETAFSKHVKIDTE